MEWQLRAPKIAHFYWGGDIMSYMRYMTIVSFMRHNPDWRMILWMPKYPSVKRTWNTRELNYDVECDDFLPRLLDLPIQKEYVDFKDFGFDNDTSEVHKSDFLRLHLLATMGGLWSDMDILYFKPMAALGVNWRGNKSKDTFVCIGPYKHSAGFLMSAPGSKYFHQLVKLAEKRYPPTVYQGIGCDMFNQFFPTIHHVNNVSPAANIDMTAVYEHNALHIPDILNGSPAHFTEGSIGIHWYAGHPLWGPFIKNTNGGQDNLPDCVISTILKMLQ